MLGLALMRAGENKPYVYAANSFGCAVGGGLAILTMSIIDSVHYPGIAGICAFLGASASFPPREKHKMLPYSTRLLF